MNKDYSSIVNTCNNTNFEGGGGVTIFGRLLKRLLAKSALVNAILRTQQSFRPHFIRLSSYLLSKCCNFSKTSYFQMPRKISCSLILLVSPALYAVERSQYGQTLESIWTFHKRESIVVQHQYISIGGVRGTG